MNQLLQLALVVLTGFTVFHLLGYVIPTAAGVWWCVWGIASAGVTRGLDQLNSAAQVSMMKDVVEIIESVATTGALIIGAWWVLKRRRIYPRAKFMHEISEVRLDDQRVLLHVAIVIENVGDVLLRLGPSVVCAQQLRPLPADHKARLADGKRLLAEGTQEVDWPILDRCDQNWEGNEFEPGEIGAFHFDLVVPGNVETVLVYSYFSNLAKSDREIGWNTSTVYNISDISA